MATALLVIDVQMAFVARRDAGQPWANPQADANIATLIAAFRDKGLPVVHVHHHGTDPRDDFYAEAPGALPQPAAMPIEGEPVFIKQGSSAFIGSGLTPYLVDQDIGALVIIGGAANYCVESTARMAGNQGYVTTVVGDALINFGARLRDGRQISAVDVLEMTLANLDDEFAHIASTNEILTQIAT